MRHLGRAAVPLLTLAFVTSVAAAKPPPSVIDVSPSRLTFEATPVGATVAKTVTVANISSSAVTLGTCSLAGDSDFTVSFDTCTNQALTPGQTCHIDVSFSPQSRGRKSATLTIRFDGGQTTVSVSGRAS